MRFEVKAQYAQHAYARQIERLILAPAFFASPSPSDQRRRASIAEDSHARVENFE